MAPIYSGRIVVETPGEAAGEVPLVNVQTHALQCACIVKLSKITSVLLSLCRKEIWPEIAVPFLFSSF